MDQIQNLADDRLLNGCLFCGTAYASTRDHVPSRCLLEKPYPPNLPVVACCADCNRGFSRDEEYFVCLIESVLCGSTDPDLIRRPSVARAMRRSPALRARIERGRTVLSSQAVFEPEWDRLLNVMIKQARGHAAYELSLPHRRAPDRLWCLPLQSLANEERERFEEPHFPELFGEVGSRATQRLQAVQAVLKSEVDGSEQVIRFLVNNWLEVQAGFYRYLAFDTAEESVVRIVVSEYLACELAWSSNLD